jgi:hypothetical protein
MAFPIQPKRNATAGSATPPAASDLLLGELAVNTQSKKTFLKANSDEVVEVGWDRILSTDAVETATAGKVVKLNSSGIISKAQISGLQYDQISDASQTSTGVANKIPLTTSSGKIDSSFLPAASVGALTYRGAWTVNTSPVIASGGVVGSGTAEKGDYYIAANSATLGTAIDGQTVVQAGDMIAFNGTTWDFIDGAKSEVRSVNSVSPSAGGNVVLTAANVEAVATADAVLTATPGKVVKLDSNGKISDVQLNVASTTQLGVISVDNASSNGFQVSVAGAAKIIPGTSTIVGGVKSSDSINIALDGTATVASAGTY